MLITQLWYCTLHYTAHSVTFVVYNINSVSKQLQGLQIQYVSTQMLLASLLNYHIHIAAALIQLAIAAELCEIRSRHSLLLLLLLERLMLALLLLLL
jgi:hypothetical protein